MKNVVTGAVALVVSVGAAHAGGIDRSGQSVAVIFEKGNYAELSFGSVSPEVSGTAVAVLGGFSSGDMADNYSQVGAAYKHSFGNGLDAAIIFDQPYGANVVYPTGTSYYATGSTAELKSNAITGVLKYTLPSNVSVYGGLRYQTFEAQAKIPFVNNYSATSNSDAGTGYLVGAAYERPDIALRVALTYNSKIKHNIETTEGTTAFGQGRVSNTAIETPQSLNLEFQSGVAANTLVFGSVRWVDWSEFKISPKDYGTVTGGTSIVSYDDDTITYALGVGRKFNDAWSGAVTVGYEKAASGSSSNLGPTNGNKSLGLGATYTRGNMKITGGVRYVWIGDAYTELGATNPAANFTDNHAVAVGLKVGYTF
ncbi:OmpP1/FadL family transporter [Pseudogemmobacter sp. W21_MBD1_M6]|uniref:OmpP1/FadL family transporter n=1 Tax=Pseudogemmobacter sp. W21_MBD1_M6 TaxID=3240271 RepID=UPI003F98E2DE